ncbi:undecaprenyldiphospho-muramoylpentapeptide beta-N-acetylglucosaminyltransferase [Treponema sp.]|uniref:undecaprenyldiphospho-muramoylpentapeptide beta-N-acetylglucosaminyltransferase n=1 Tax=Treponema sp. TaxID=166 RepID=UPI00388DA26D
MSENKKKYVIAITGGGTGGHIYPGIAVADEIRNLVKDADVDLKIHWIGSSKGMDRTLVEKSFVSNGGSIDAFHGIPCGKLRRYISFQNFVDLFRIFAGFVKAFFVLAKLKPDVLFSKGGFVSVPPCMAASILKIPFFTHECDFTPGLATRINSKKAKNVLVSYEDTKKYFSEPVKSKCLATGNPVRPVFYSDHAAEGRKFLGIPEDNKKPVLLVIGGSLGALQINSLVVECLEELKKNFIVVHQTGKAFADAHPEVMNSGDENYKPYAFIYSEMVSVLQAADVVLSRAGANSLSECAVCAKPMVLVPLCGSGTRGDQVDNARYFEEKGAAVVLVGDDATKENLLVKILEFTDEGTRRDMSMKCSALYGDKRPVNVIASKVLEEIGL